MNSTKKEMLAILDKMKSIRVLVVGDIILDRYVWGRCERISAEAPVPVVDVKKIEDRLGGAGNVVNNLNSLGVPVSLCGFIGDDDEGQVVLRILEGLKVQHDGVVVDRGRPTSLKTRVIAQSQQVVRIDRERKNASVPALKEAMAAVVDSQIATSQALIVSDYAKGVVSEHLTKKLYEARQDGRLGLATVPYVVDPHPDHFSLYRGISLAKPNRKEAELSSGVTIDSREKALEAAVVLREKWEAEMMMITLGDDGLMILPPRQNSGIFLDTVAQDVFDVSGAGDTVTAVYAAAIAAGASYALAGDLANIAAGIVVSEVGTVPVNSKRFATEIERLGS